MRWLDRVTFKTVVVHTTTGSSLRGVLKGVYADCVVLTSARYLYAEGFQDVDGEAIVPRPQVAWIQVLTPGGEDER